MNQAAEPVVLAPGPTAGASEDGAQDEIYSIERLEAHAADVAREHGEPALDVRARPLLASFQATRKAIESAYAALAHKAQKRSDATPAEEWLLDNSHVIDDQLHEIEEDLPSGYLMKLPRLASGARAGYPRVYALALDLIGHTDGRIDREMLVRYVTAYQSLRPLTIGELWAVPIMLRLGLAESVRRLADQELATGEDRALADTWVARMLKGAGPRRSTDVAVAMAELAVSDDVLKPAFVVQLMRRLREHDAVVTSAIHWIQERCAEIRVSPEELTRLEHLRQASAQVSIGNAITSMRVIAALDWGKFFEQTSEVEHVLHEDPAGAYDATDAASRDRYRHAVEDLAARSAHSELAVARMAIERAAAAKAGAPVLTRTSHVGYYLVDRGRRELERAVGYRIPVVAWLRRTLTEHATAAYLGALGLGTAAFVALLLTVARDVDHRSLPTLVILGFLLLNPCAEVAITWVNWIVTATLPPRILTKLAFEAGIPADCRTLVVVPALIGRESDVRELLEELEVRSLANPGQNLHFALLTDFPDADVEERPGEAELLDMARRGIATLNERQEAGRRDRYVLLHRRRLFDAVDQRWMGWERKRGKLEELNRLLRDKGDTSFTVVTAETALLRSVRYVLTLDADTHLPRDVVQRLVATIAHPLNQAELDASGTRVVRGYGVIQPRVGTTLGSTSRSIFAGIYGGRAGIDPYTTAVSDVYQDLFAEGVYIGKALYDVDAFEAAIAGRIPENRMLSHDLFEGLYARTALATDIELLDDQPSGYAVHAGRQHRWVRGDWQLASWLLPWVPRRGGGSRPNDLPLLGRWKIFDNLRRSLLAPSMVAVLVLAWLFMPRTAGIWTGVVAVALATPLFSRFATALIRPDDRGWSRASFDTLWGDVRANLLQVVLATTLMLDQAMLMLDAIGRTLYRVSVGRNLLEWMTVSDAERRSASGGRLARMWLGALASVSLAVGMVIAAPRALPLALPVLFAWAVAPLVASWISKPAAPRERPLSAANRIFLRRAARKTWRFFDVFVTAADNWLPPDNYQEDPKGEIAHRTSPTNIGLYLLSTVAARDFGYLTLGELSARVESTLDTVGRLELHAGHVLNWYETTTLKALAPRYVSTVDSGNLAAHLWALAQACDDVCDEPIVTTKVFDAALDAVALFREALAGAKPKTAALSAAQVADLDAMVLDLERALRAPPADARGWSVTLATMAVLVEPLAAWGRALPGRAADPEVEAVAYWIDSVACGLGDAATELRELGADRDAGASGAPPLATCPTLRSLAILDPGGPAAARLTRLAALGARAMELADGMRFGMLYDQDRKLFSIGYDVTASRLDASYYDLLASEARLASLVAIAKAEVPQEHWFRLGRQLTATADRRALLSWSGSMFEYLMPLLVTRTYERTLLDETYVAVVERQREYGGQRKVAWGISESAYNTLDLGLTYQYHAFGVPGLGLKPGLADELVVAPYASALASLVHPDDASKNLRALAREGLDGPYGFYDSIDYTPAHVPPGRRGVVVKAYMAHHQGMSLVALDNVLNGDPMVRRFHVEPRVKATELLLQERVPVVSTLTQPRAAAVVHTGAAVDEGGDAVEPCLDGERSLAARAPARLRRVLHPAHRLGQRVDEVEGARRHALARRRRPRCVRELLLPARSRQRRVLVRRLPADAASAGQLRRGLRGRSHHVAPARRGHRDADRDRGLARAPGRGAARDGDQPLRGAAPHRADHLRRGRARRAWRRPRAPRVQQHVRRDRGGPHPRRRDGDAAPPRARRSHAVGRPGHGRRGGPCRTARARDQPGSLHRPRSHAGGSPGARGPRPARGDDGDGARPRALPPARARAPRRRPGEDRRHDGAGVDARGRARARRAVPGRPRQRPHLRAGVDRRPRRAQAPRGLRGPGAALPAAGLGGGLPQRRAPGRPRGHRAERPRQGGPVALRDLGRPAHPARSPRRHRVRRAPARGAPRPRVLAPQRPDGRSGHPQRGAEQLPPAAAGADAEGPPREPDPGAPGPARRRVRAPRRSDARGRSGAPPGHGPRHAALLARLAHAPAPAHRTRAVCARGALRRAARGDGGGTRADRQAGAALLERARRLPPRRARVRDGPRRPRRDAGPLVQRHRQPALRLRGVRERRELHVGGQQPDPPAHARGPTTLSPIRRARPSISATTRTARSGRRRPSRWAASRRTSSGTARATRPSSIAAGPSATSSRCSCRATPT